MDPRRISYNDIVINDNPFHVIVIPHDNGSQHTLVIEPFTWAWVGLMICEGILQAIGALIFSQLFGQDSLTKTDLASALREFLSAVATVLRQVIQQEEIEKLDAAAQGLMSSFNTYVTTKDTRWLVPIMQQADTLIAQYARFPYQTIGAFATVGSLELAALQEGAKTASTQEVRDGYLKRVSSRATELLNQADHILPALTAYNLSRFSAVTSHGGFGGHRPIGFWGYVIDGHTLNFLSRDDAERDRNARITSQINYLTQQIVQPIYPVEDKWKQIAAG
jgi:hypothetical protein